MPPAWSVSGQSRLLRRPKERKREMKRTEMLVEWCRGRMRKKKIKCKRENSKWRETEKNEGRRDGGLSSKREEYGVFYGFSQATLSFYFPLFKCQGRLTKTSRGATALFPASAKHDASNEFLGDPSSRAVIFADSVVFVVTASFSTTNNAITSFLGRNCLKFSSPAPLSSSLSFSFSRYSTLSTER